MDSLLANYASSDEDEEQQHDSPPRTAAQPKSTPKSLLSSIPPPNPSSSGLFSLPKPKSLFSSIPPPNPSSSDLFSLPKPKSRIPKPPVIGNQNDEDEFVHSGESSLFSVLPQPKTSLISSLPLPLTLPKGQDGGPTRPSPTVAPAKKVIKLRPPLLSSDGGDDEDDDEEEDERKRRRKLGEAQLSWAVMPAPKNSASLGSSSLGSGSSRRSIIDMPALKNSSTGSAAKAVVVDQGLVSSAAIDQGFVSSAAKDQGFVSSAVVDQGSVSSSGCSSENYAGYGSDYSNLAPGTDGNYSYSGDHGNFANYEHYQGNQIEHYQSNEIEEPTVSLGGMGGGGGFQMPGKRGRNNVAVEMVEVSQDELMKDRPREDQSKLTGIAFGPSYAPVSAKGKPNKLHKRKHQIGTLYVDMKAKETELAERRAKGFLTKAQTQGKYGW